MPRASYSFRATALAVVALVGFVAGCEKRTGSVSGKVTYNGKPVANAQVNFVPAGGYPVAVVTDESGSYTVSGVLYGSSKVTVFTLGEPLIGASEQERPSPEERQKERERQVEKLKNKGRDKNKDDNKAPALVLPGKYREPGTTPLIHNVTSENSTFDIVLKD